jgi:hypothetical protein
LPTESSDANPSAITKATEHAISAIHKEMDSPGVTFSVVAGTCAIALAIQLILDYCSRVHWILAALFSLAIALVFIWFTRMARRPPLASTRAMCAAFLSLGLMIAVVVAGWASYTLHSLGLGAYTVTPLPSIDVFMRLYFFALADLIPAIKVTETLHLKSPVEARDFVAGLPVLAFRIFVLWFVFDAFKTWRKSRQDAGKEKSSDIVLFLIFLLVFVATVLRNLK